MIAWRQAALAAACTAVLIAAPLAAAAATGKPPVLSIAVSSLKVLDNDTRRVSFKAIPPQQIKSYSWSFGDPATGAQNRSAAAQPTHVFAAHKTYVVTLAVVTRQGGHAKAVLRLAL